MISPHVHVPYEKIGLHLQFLNEHRPNLEIYFNSSVLDNVSTASLKGVKGDLRYTPVLSLHAPFMDLSPAAVDAKVRQATIARFDQMLQVAEALKPECIVFHSGYEKWKYALAVELWLEKSLETWVPLNEKAKNIGVKIAIENIFEDEPSNLRLLMQAMDSSNFGVCFDTGHCNLFSKVPLQSWIDALGTYILEFHLHDNDKSADQHLPIGDGNFDFQLLFSTFKRTPCIFTIEAHSPERVLKSIDRFNTLLGLANK